VFADARADDGAARAGIVTADGLIEWTRTLARTAADTPSRSPFVLTTKAHSVEVELGRKVLYELDGGDGTKTKSLRIDLKPAAGDVCVPPPAGSSSGVCPGFALSRTRQLEKMEKLAHLVSGLGRMPHLDVGPEVVAIPPSDLLALRVAGLDQIGDDPLRSPFGDPDHLREIPEPNVGIPSDAEQHLSVIREEAPAVIALIT
jgi:hypothetical protein